MSVGSRRMYLCDLLPMRASEANSSPCAPVARMMRFSCWIVLHVFDRDDGVILVFDEAQLARDLDVGAHRASVDDDLLAVLLLQNA